MINKIYACSIFELDFIGLKFQRLFIPIGLPINLG
jgi:hypothetical protein